MPLQGLLCRDGPKARFKRRIGGVLNWRRPPDGDLGELGTRYQATNPDIFCIIVFYLLLLVRSAVGVACIPMIAVLEIKTVAVLLQGGPRDAAVHFDTYRILQRHCAVSLPQHAFLVGLCLQTAVNYLSKSDKY